eukprot:6179356-Pleurochrysis_carterae.AAC.2
MRLRAGVAVVALRFCHQRASLHHICSCADGLVEELLQQTTVLASSANARVKLARKLHTRHGRKKAERVLLEGHRLVSDALEAGHEADFVFFTREALYAPEGTRLATSMAKHLQPEQRAIASAEIIAALADTQNPQVNLRFRSSRRQQGADSKLDGGIRQRVEKSLVKRVERVSSLRPSVIKRKHKLEAGSPQGKGAGWRYIRGADEHGERQDGKSRRWRVICNRRATGHLSAYQRCYVKTN